MSDHDRLIERYIARRMSPREEEEFLRMVDSDAALRRVLEAERIVQGTLLRDRDAIAPVDARERASFVALLSSLPEGAPALAPAVVATKSFWFAGKAVQGIVALLAVATPIVVWNLFSTGDASHSGPERKVAPAISPSPSISTPADVAAPDLPTISAAPIIPSQSPAPSKSRENALSKERSANNASHSTMPEESSPKLQPSESPSSPAELPTSAIEHAPEREEVPARNVVADTMRLDVKLNLEKLKRKDR